MIVNPSYNKNSTILDAINGSKIKFYRTGSRYFGTAKPESDWDFFTSYEVKTAHFLESIGFRTVSNPSYASLDICIVYRAKYMDSHIDVQLVTDAEKKNAAQEMLEMSCALHYVPKVLHSRLWDMALAAVNNNVMIGGI